MQERTKYLLGRSALGFAVIAVLGISVSIWMFSRWTEVRSVIPEEAQRAFAEQIEATGGGPAYVTVAEGRVGVRRELEGELPQKLEALGMLAFEPDERRLSEIRFPYWFVRVKLNDTLNLGTLTTLVAGDWRHIDLKITEDDLERRGPGLILDELRADGARIIVWTE